MLGEVVYQFLGLPAFSKMELVVLLYFSRVGLISSLINLVERPPLWQVGPAILLPHHGLKKSHFNTLDFLFHPDNYTIIRLHSKKKIHPGVIGAEGRGEATQIPLLFLREGLGERMQISQAEKEGNEETGKEENLNTYLILISPLCAHLKSLRRFTGADSCQ